MKVEIWSDIMCPFCYMGKRLFEEALEEFAHKDKVMVEWKSFLLSPELKTNPSISLTDHLSQSKGMSPHDVEHMTGNIVARAKTIGLDFQFDKVVVANTIKAHALIKFAQEEGKDNEAYELIFKGYFCEGKNVDDLETLLDIAKSLDLNIEKFKEGLENKSYELKVFNDYKEAQGLGIQGVPFFVLDRKLAVSGAQAKETFLGALNQAFKSDQL
ncbi:MAG TPA: DsbA family oxidoreductase [Bacteriovoracaceae bacterium]|nr:DsbA family oxidoreductase [Bacteriovoracaceae bacterium]